MELSALKKENLKEEKGGNILIVDDESIVRVSLTALLSEEGFNVDSAGSGEEALKKVSTGGWDLLMVDIKMPGMDGIELLKKIKGLQPEIPIIIITAYASIGTAVNAMKSGAEDYLVKPFNTDELKFVIQKTINHQKVKIENIRLKKQLQEKFGLKYYCEKCGHEMTRVIEAI
ncbi:MAG: sigma-54-dependent transcriptional regulator [Fidelibacterota bacterium]